MVTINIFRKSNFNKDRINVEGKLIFHGLNTFAIHSRQQPFTLRSTLLIVSCILCILYFINVGVVKLNGSGCVKSVETPSKGMDALREY